MAAPTPTTYTRSVGHERFLFWNAVWADTTNLTASAVIDLSAEGTYNSSICIHKIKVRTTAGIEATLLFDAGTDQMIYTSQLAGVDDDDVDPTLFGLDGFVPTAAGATGDLLITTTSAAAADEVTLMIWYRVS